ncbi:helix-turn-helix domain-containing protein [Litoreibacter albidus]|uniref:Transcriptional regulator, contains XRE-family HTH domain n=1 Tax=Litoreibacter albidus TaxID=670155 RepID=A0A1H2RBF3_9RHOB|nr:helix-turn-helix transcriptional regulator [Litoreibacter albidus]SDW16737.1 Transcriptional regulator, contains XRE-family HTH domain [Litoreibacter albidus]
MTFIIDKRDRAELFRARVAQAMDATQISQSALARAIGVDRSTVSQLLKSTTARLPNAQVVGECARVLGVSADWLLGLTDRPELAVDLMASALSFTEAPRALADEQIHAWHREAEGYKIRHVPASLHDMLKTRDMLEWEYTPHLGRTTAQAVGASKDNLNWMRSTGSDYEIAFPVHELSAMAKGCGYYDGLPVSTRRAQLERLRHLHDQLYPTLRLHMFDARKLYSAPVTIFGPKLAVIYLGRNYLAFRDKERVQAITQHFDGLVREAQISSRDVPKLLDTLINDLT